MTLKQDLWENDPSLVPVTPARQKSIHDMSFRFFRDHDIPPHEAFTDGPLQKAYAEWLKTNPKES